MASFSERLIFNETHYTFNSMGIIQQDFVMCLLIFEFRMSKRQNWKSIAYVT